MRVQPVRVLVVAAVVLLVQASSFAQDVKGQVKPAVDDDHAVVLEIGGVLDWEHGERALHGGGTFAFEVTPIENILELEIGISAVPADGGVEMPIDVLFKKPWRFSPKFEFMIGAGPEVVRSFGPDPGTFWGVEGVLDFMFWPRKNVGWYIEPGYEVTFRDGARQHGLGVSGGLLVGR